MKAFNSLIVIGIVLMIAVAIAFYYTNNSTDMAPGSELSTQETSILWYNTM